MHLHKVIYFVKCRSLISRKDIISSQYSILIYLGTPAISVYHWVPWDCVYTKPLVGCSGKISKRATDEITIVHGAV